MPSWSEFAEQEPDLAQKARRFLDANKHKIVATIRRDGSPRVSGTETQFCLGALYLGTMPGAARVADLHRDPRCAIHSSSADPGPDNDGWDGDAKLTGRAVEVTDLGEQTAWAAELGFEMEPGEGQFVLFRVEVDEVAVTSLNDDRTALIVDFWTAGKGRRQVER